MSPHSSIAEPLIQETCPCNARSARKTLAPIWLLLGLGSAVLISLVYCPRCSLGLIAVQELADTASSITALTRRIVQKPSVGRYHRSQPRTAVMGRELWVAASGLQSSHFAVIPHSLAGNPLPHAWAATVIRNRVHCSAVGEDFEGLILEDTLGSGSFGTTWSANATSRCDPKLGLDDGQRVAIKIIRLSEGWTSVDSFEREAAVLQRLRHPAIPRYFGAVIRDRPDGQDFGLVSSVVSGQTLEDLLISGRWTADGTNMRALAETLLDVCSHLASFAPPVVHCDIKPSNIVLEAVPAVDGEQTPRWHVYLVDFGAAKQGSGTRATAAGTFGYMAPESFGRVFTPKSDLYGVGATLLFAATGLDPGSLPVERLQIQFRKALTGTIWELQEPWFAELLDRLLAPAPEDRFSTAVEAMKFLRGEPSKAEWRPPAEALAEAGTSLEPPRGSAVRAEQKGYELRILFPPPSVADSLPQGAFAVAWTAFTGVWTAGVLTAGAPIMALFSLPFWISGGDLLKKSFKPLLQGSTELKIGRKSWSFGRLNKEEFIAEGSTAGLKCKDLQSKQTQIVSVNGVMTEEVSDGPATLLLEEGTYQVPIGEGLLPVEVEWLKDIISKHIDRCRGA
eukprot:gnl/TRDRNA2_/TRDRNA2_165171_c1_seq1.p1 gnl/TRDRNA2_/TRDRNA2_165171_c1~~gnl/TRDRNA2_/TRDRNA2_165171_c1_seq1.p1  ORF type:complete len:621 (-),score=83.37 gnl/TRDRNA2_/TRDRNA2_165171_c1_seq1:116-1978(-)